MVEIFNTLVFFFCLFVSKSRDCPLRALVIGVGREETRIALCLSSDSFPVGREKKTCETPPSLADCKHGRSVVRELDERRR